MSDQEQNPPNNDEDLAFYIRAFWEAIISAPWDKDSLIELGKLAYAKTLLKDVPDKTFFRLLPNLKIVAGTFSKLTESRITSPATAATPAPATGSPDTAPAAAAKPPTTETE